MHLSVRGFSLPLGIYGDFFLAVIPPHMYMYIIAVSSHNREH